MQETNRHELRYDVVVVGGGSAGLSAALVLGRSRRRTLVLDSGEPRNAPSSGVHGFFSRDGIPPEELLEVGREQLEPYPSVEVCSTRVTGTSGDNGDFEVTLENRTVVRARKLLLATGVVDELPEKPGFTELWGRGVYHCPYCHGWEVRDRPLAVLNSGEGAAERAAFIRNWSRDLVLLTDGPTNLNEEGRRTLRALDIPVREERISHLEGGAAGGLRRIHFEDGSPLEREGLFYVPPQRQGSGLAKMLGCEIVAMGQAPAGVKSDPATRETTVAGVYVAGDGGNAVQSALLAAASGAKAAFFMNHALVADEVAAAVGAAT
ncbi:NAD(P)/FAD-dependent oxidoreductase [Rubrobacter tropicus]|uniref:NAD(P)/FAD-dependent oxidoreductase n=1 Tax=Rubrobacter tropicus TaxID=2653851 RepID=UPI00140A0357|nr:NAD(P)/FAD-dependent oxidoreductase [Rubrobacter tropicus]